VIVKYYKSISEELDHLIWNDFFSMKLNSNHAVLVEYSGYRYFVFFLHVVLIICVHTVLARH